MNKYKIIKNVLQFSIFIFVITYIYFNVSYQELIKIFYINDNLIYLIFLYIFVAFTVNIYQAKRWGLLIEHFNEKADFKQYLKIITYSNLLAEISFLGIFSRALIRLYSRIKIVNVFITLLIEKFMSLYAILFLSAFSIFLLYQSTTFEYYNDYFKYIFFIIFLGLTSPYILLKISESKYLIIFNKLKRFFIIFYFLKKEYFFKVFLKTLIIQILAIIKVFIVTRMFDLDVNIILLILILPIINFFVSIPASITPWGWREFIYINILSFLGLSNEQSILISLTNSVLLVSSQFLFYLIFLRVR